MPAPENHLSGVKSTSGFEFPSSCSGHNAYCIKCEAKIKAGDRFAHMNYGVCQFIIKAFMDKHLRGAFEDCQRHIASRECQAIRMIAEEKKTGKILYWEDRYVNHRGKLTMEEQAAQAPTEREKVDYLAVIREMRAEGFFDDSPVGRSKQKQVWGFPPDDSSLDAHVADKNKARKLRVSSEPAPKRDRLDMPKTVAPKPVEETTPVADFAAVVTKMAEQENAA